MRSFLLPLRAWAFQVFPHKLISTMAKSQRSRLSTTNFALGERRVVWAGLGCRTGHPAASLSSQALFSACTLSSLVLGRASRLSRRNPAISQHDTAAVPTWHSVSVLTGVNCGFSTPSFCLLALKEANMKRRKNIVVGSNRLFITRPPR